MKTDISVLGELTRIRDGDDDDGSIVIELYEILATVLAKYFTITVLSLTQR